jgi:AcrR family transcriptional regulator
MAARRARGPRGAGVDTRAEILAAAVTVFSEHGFDGTSLRAIAREAGVDPGLIRHYFDSKADLFVAALRPIPPGDPRLTALLEGDPDTAGERLITTFLTLWDDPELQPQLRAILVSALSSPEVADSMAALLLGELLAGLTRSIGGDNLPMRASACASQLAGLALARYVLRFEPIASAPPAQVVALYGPTLQRYLTGAIGGNADTPRA